VEVIDVRTIHSDKGAGGNPCGFRPRGPGDFPPRYNIAPTQPIAARHPPSLRHAVKWLVSGARLGFFPARLAQPKRNAWLADQEYRTRAPSEPLQVVGMV
jgi:hypothetical protein